MAPPYRKRGNGGKYALEYTECKRGTPDKSLEREAASQTSTGGTGAGPVFKIHKIETLANVRIITTGIIVDNLRDATRRGWSFSGTPRRIFEQTKPARNQRKQQRAGGGGNLNKHMIHS